MINSIKEYKKFIDDLVGLRPNMSATWVLSKKKWPETENSPENKEINLFIESLDDSQREQLANLLNDAYDSGIHDVLAYLDEQINLKKLRIWRGWRKIAVEPFDTEMHYDFVCRCEGDDWPDEKK